MQAEVIVEFRMEGGGNLVALTGGHLLAQESGYHSYSTFSAAFRQRMHKNVTDWMREEVFLQM